MINEMDSNDLNSVIDMIKSRRSQLSRMATMSFEKGDKVWWDGKRGRVEGTIVKVNRTRIVVDEDMKTSSSFAMGTRWSVTANMLNLQ